MNHNPFNDESLAPNGRPVLENFSNWFESSAVTSGDGSPMRMFHASYRDLQGGEFNRNKSLEWRRPSMDTVGVWFSSNPSEDGGAGMYAGGEGARIYPVYLSIQRPKCYATFKDFLAEMHEACGEKLAKPVAPGLGSTEGLRQKLKVQGYDGIAFLPTENQALMDEIGQYDTAVRSAHKDALTAPSSEWPIYAAKTERLKQKLQSLRSELHAFGESTEFDKQWVFVAFEPWQIKSAVGNSGLYLKESASIDDQEAARRLMLASVAANAARQTSRVLEIHP